MSPIPPTGLLVPLDPSAFDLDSAEGPVQLLQTHIGQIYLTRSHAFKIKKHVKFDFLDFTTLEQRRWACEREIALNRRLCPNLYRALIPVVKGSDGRMRVVSDSSAATNGEIIDWCVWMRRLPMDRMLDSLLEKNAVSAPQAEAIAETLAAFYLQQRGTIAPGGLGDLESVRVNVEENLREGEALDAAVLAPEALKLISTRACRFLQNHAEVLRQRARDGFIVDGHGDLRAENICLPEAEPPLLFDCIEFNDRFRILDSALDVAYLVMDFDSRGREDLSRALLARYMQRCDPTLPPELLNFYLGYRAFIKAKVSAWIMGDPQVGQAQRDSSRAQASGLFDLAVRYAIQNKPILFVICGVAGSGKSTLARKLSARLKCEHAATDFVRDEVLPRGIPPAERYAPAISQRVYQILDERAAKALSERRAIVLDGTFTRRATRARPVEIARQQDATSILIWANCPENRIESHFQSRAQSGDLHGSEAEITVAREQLAGFEFPLAGEGFDAVCEIDTSAPVEAAQQKMWRHVMEALTAKLG
jgi:aminoglycoside phosphotransferase family enzyme/predicted kinase